MGQLAQSTNTVTIALQSDADFTPTLTQTANHCLRVTSSVALTLTRNIVMPLQQSPPSMGSDANGAQPDWLVHNATTGGQSLQFIGPSGTGVTVANGAKANIYTDGTNFY